MSNATKESMTQVVLSLFPGVGLLDMAFELEGFCVVQSRDWIMGGDIRKTHFPRGRFDGVIGGPPCQAFSRLAHLIRHNGHEPLFGNLIPDFERAVNEVQPTWFVMENVPEAPTPQPIGYATWSTILNNRQCIDADGKPATQNRTRRWTFGDKRSGQRTVLMIDTVAIENHVFERIAMGGSSGSSLGAKGWDGGSKTEREKRQKGSGVLFRNGPSSSMFKTICERQGLPADFDLPAFTVAAKCKAVGNGVPIPMGRAIAKAVCEATRSASAIAGEPQTAAQDKHKEI
jgi:DNA (cytosine-5)-methyltransferase 1